MVRVNLPHIVFQPLEGQVQYKTADITPVFWFHYTPDILVVPEQSPLKSFAEFIAAAKKDPGKMNLGAQVSTRPTMPGTKDLTRLLASKAPTCPTKGWVTALAVMGNQIDGAVICTAVAMEKRHLSIPDVPTFKELGVDWVDGAYRGIGVPKSTPPEARKKLSDTWAALNTDPETKDLAAKSGFELINVGTDQMDAFMKDKIKLYTEGAARLNLGKKLSV